jgi:hypothetical protein
MVAEDRLGAGVYFAKQGVDFRVRGCSANHRILATDGHRYVLVSIDKKVVLHFDNRIMLPKLAERRKGRRRKVS